jgi:hypothetical protein
VSCSIPPDSRKSGISGRLSLSGLLYPSIQDRANAMLHQQPMQQGIQRPTSGTDVHRQRNMELRHNRLLYGRFKY